MEATAKKIMPVRSPLVFMFLRNKQPNIDHRPLLSTSNGIFRVRVRSADMSSWRSRCPKAVRGHLILSEIDELTGGEKETARPQPPPQFFIINFNPADRWDNSAFDDLHLLWFTSSPDFCRPLLLASYFETDFFKNHDNIQQNFVNFFLVAQELWKFRSA